MMNNQATNRKQIPLPNEDTPSWFNKVARTALSKEHMLQVFNN
jgi:hypothetical protein